MNDQSSVPVAVSPVRASAAVGVPVVASLAAVVVAAAEVA